MVAKTSEQTRSPRQAQAVTAVTKPGAAQQPVTFKQLRQQAQDDFVQQSRRLKSKGELDSASAGIQRAISKARTSFQSAKEKQKSFAADNKALQTKNSTAQSAYSSHDQSLQKLMNDMDSQMANLEKNDQLRKAMNDAYMKCRQELEAKLQAM